jgi:hypothetical protein
MNMKMKMVGIAKPCEDGSYQSTFGEVDLTNYVRPFMSGKECGFEIDLSKIPQNICKIKLSNVIEGDLPFRV